MRYKSIRFAKSWHYGLYLRFLGGRLILKVAKVMVIFDNVRKPPKGWWHPTWYKYYLIRKAKIELEYYSVSVCSDPMNGCPGDFAEDFSKKGERMYWAAYQLEQRIPKWVLKIIGNKLNKVHDKEQEQLMQLPWMGE